MTNTQKTAVTALTSFKQMLNKPEGAYEVVLGILNKDENKAQNLMRAIISAVQADKSGKLFKSTPQSVIEVCRSVAQTGLIPNTEFDHAYLIPYEDKKTGLVTMQYQLGYKGFIELDRKSGAVKWVQAFERRKLDKFAMQYGSSPTIKHIPNVDAVINDKENPVLGVYAIAKLTNNEKLFVYLSVEECNKYRDMSQGWKYKPQDSFWTKFPSDMRKKTAIKRLQVYLPLTPQLAVAMNADNVAEYGHITSENEELLETRVDNYKQDTMVNTVKNAMARNGNDTNVTPNTENTINTAKERDQKQEKMDTETKQVSTDGQIEWATAEQKKFLHTILSKIEKTKESQQALFKEITGYEHTSEIRKVDVEGVYQELVDIANQRHIDLTK